MVSGQAIRLIIGYVTKKKGVASIKNTKRSSRDIHSSFLARVASIQSSSILTVVFPQENIRGEK